MNKIGVVMKGIDRLRKKRTFTLSKFQEKGQQNSEHHLESMNQKEKVILPQIFEKQNCACLPEH